MKRFTLISMMLLLSVAMFARVDNYRVNNDAVDALFENATEITSPVMGDLTTDLPDGFNNTMNFTSGSKDPIIAFVICWFVGYLGVHRLYLGTETIIFIAYFCTGGGCGIVVTVDWIMLLIGVINDDIDQYIDNPKFFMWM
jgi:TM2 domain-containing membrane protein YozV